MPTNVGAKYANAISQRLDGIAEGRYVFRDVGCCYGEVAVDDRLQNVLEVDELLGWADAGTMMRLQLKESTEWAEKEASCSGRSRSGWC